jgi:hypothetical protein
MAFLRIIKNNLQLFGLEWLKMARNGIFKNISAQNYKL